MASSLFQVASLAARRYARRRLMATHLGRVVSEVRRYTSGRGSQRRMRSLLDRMSSPEFRRLMSELERSGAAVTRYGAKEEFRAVFHRLLGMLGPLGDALRGIVSPGARGVGEDAYRAAVDVIRAFGGEVLTKPGQPGYERGLAAARQVLTEAIGQSLPSKTKATPAPPEEERWHEEHTIQTVGRGSLGYDLEGTRKLVEKEILTPGSSNVYSFVFEPESPRTGILYVTFLAWTPGTGKRHGPGPTYAYYDVPVKKYVSFKREATGRSAGEAVWDYLRVRGSKWEHQHQYRLGAATLVQETGEFYVPRKATRRGFKTRHVPDWGVGRRGAMRSTLPPREFVERARPNRARPNRGRPDNGGPGRDLGRYW